MAVTVDPGMVALGRGGLLKNCTMSADFLRKLRDRRKLDFVSSGAAEPRRRNFYSAKVGHELNNGPDGEFHKSTPQPQANGGTALFAASKSAIPQISQAAAARANRLQWSRYAALIPGIMQGDNHRRF
jgi:hypothetical protein